MSNDSDPFIADELANERCKTSHPRRWRDGLPCRECIAAVGDAAPLTNRLEQIIRHEISTEVERLCIDSVRASGSQEHATVRVSDLRAMTAKWRLVRSS